VPRPGLHDGAGEAEGRHPGGRDNNSRMRLSGKGEPGMNGGPPGDLYVFIKVQEHPVFERREKDLHCAIPINIAQAALGAEIEVPTLDGAQSLKIPEGTQTGATFKLRGQGVPDVSGHGRATCTCTSK